MPRSHHTGRPYKQRPPERASAAHPCDGCGCLVPHGIEPGDEDYLCHDCARARAEVAEENELDRWTW